MRYADRIGSNAFHAVSVTVWYGMRKQVRLQVSTRLCLASLSTPSRSNAPEELPKVRNHCWCCICSYMSCRAEPCG
jgi:hypothetical protein